MEVYNTLLNHIGPRQLILKRLYNAPVGKVFIAWTDPRQVARWWGPRGFTNPVCTWEAKPYGHIYLEMTDATGTAHPMGGTFHEVDEGKRLLFTTTIIAHDAHNPSLKVLNAVKFTQRGEQTEIVINATVQYAAPAIWDTLAGMDEGWCQSLDKLEEILG